jgi:hypothetical protein
VPFFCETAFRKYQLHIQVRKSAEQEISMQQGTSATLVSFLADFAG